MSRPGSSGGRSTRLLQSSTRRRPRSLTEALARRGRLVGSVTSHVCEAPRPVRVGVGYDCLFPYTVGGAERWYRSLAQPLAADGHEVTYLALRQWARGAHGEVP